MTTNRRYLILVALLAVLAVVFGIVGTVAPPLAEAGSVSPQQESPLGSGAIGHFQNPPAYDSGWIDIRSKLGQYVTLKHDLNTTEVVVDITGKQSLDSMDGSLAWDRTYGGTKSDAVRSMVQTRDGGYALAGVTSSYGAGNDFWLVKTDASGATQWSKTYGGINSDTANSVVQTGDGGYAISGYTYSYGAGAADFWLVKTDEYGNMLWSKTYGGTGEDYAYSLIQMVDGGYALAGYTDSFGAGLYDMWLVKVNAEMNAEHQWNLGVETGLAWKGLTNTTITIYRGQTDTYWNYVRIRMWPIQEPTWIYGDINMDGIVDAKDLYIVSRNYGKTFSLLSLSGITAIAGILTIKKRKQPKQTN